MSVAETLTALIRAAESSDPLRLDPVPAPHWPELIARAAETDVLGMLAARAVAAGAPDDVAERLNAHMIRETRHHALCFVEAERLTSALQAQGIRCAVLKGAALARQIYSRPGERSFRDLDLLVAPADRDAAHRVLVACGYTDGVPPRLVEIYRRHHFHLILEGPGRPRVELHWSLVRPDEPYRLDAADLLQGAAELPGVNAFPSPHPDGQLLHAVASLLRSGFTELKRLVDIDRLIRSGAAIRWDRVAESARRAHLAPALRLALELAAELLGTNVTAGCAALPALGVLRHRLDAIGVAGFPLGEPPSDWRPVRHAVRFWLLDRRVRVALQFVTNPRFERARLAALGTPFAKRLLVTGKRTVIAAWLAGWQLGLVQAPHRLSRSSG